jgi:DNA (cytosine-5)-methyltransferase 1
VSKPRLLDLFCGAGGAAMGYHRAGFEVVGVDIRPQPHYPFEFVQADVLTFPYGKLKGFDAIHASPPCQAYSSLKSKTKRNWPDLIAPTRTLLQATGLLYVMENVMPAPLRGVVLCGSMFGLRTHRHRRFETNWLILQPSLHEYGARMPRTTTRKRRADYADGAFISVTGDVGSYVGPTAMGIDWMTGNELSEAIPPAYTEWIGQRLFLTLAAVI